MLLTTTRTQVSSSLVAYEHKRFGCGQGNVSLKKAKTVNKSRNGDSLDATEQERELMGLPISFG